MTAAVVALAVLAVVYSAWPIWRALFQIELSLDEAWNAYHADDVLAARPLYPAPDSLVTNNYPPLSFCLAAFLSRLSGADPAFVGRALSFAAVGVTGIAAGACVRNLGGSRIAAAVAGLWLVATMVRSFDAYIGTNELNIVGLAVTVTALAWFLHRQARSDAPEPAILLMVMAGFFKHTLIATPAAALLWLLASNRKTGVRAAVVGAGGAAIGLALCAGIFGMAFVQQLLFFPREYSLRWALGSLGQLQWIAPALVIWALWAWPNRHSAAARFSALYIASAFVIYFLLRIGRPSGVNAQFELIAATAIGLGFAFHGAARMALARRWGVDATRLTILAALMVRLLLSNHVEAYLVLASADYRRQFSEHEALSRREIERVRAVPGPAFCEVTMICRWAGKEFVFDPYAAGLAVAVGRMTAEELQTKMRAAGISHIGVDPRTTSRSLERKLFQSVR